MPHEDEQIVRHRFDPWNQGDFDALEDIFDPDLEIDATNRVLNPPRYRGIEGFEQLTREKPGTQGERFVASE